MIGFAGTFAFLLLGAILLVLRLVGVIEVEGYTAIMVAILLSASLILLGLGIVGNYVWLAKWGNLGQWLAAHGVTFADSRGLVRTGLINWLVILLFIVWLAPNSQQIMERARPALAVRGAAPYSGRWLWRPARWLAVPVALLAVVCVVNLHKRSEFLYFQF